MAYIDKGAIAVDSEQGDITADIVTTGVDDVDLTTEGTYVIGYTVTDNNGATSTKNRNVHVLAENDFDFEVRVKSSYSIAFSFTGDSMYYSIDGGAIYTAYPYGLVISSTAYIHLRGKGITAFNNTQNASRITEVYVYRAYDIRSTFRMFYNHSRLAKFETAHPNVFINVTDAYEMFYNCGSLKFVGAMNYVNFTRTEDMFQNCANMKCIAGTIDIQSGVNTTNMFDNTGELLAPNDASKADILLGISWTNPGTCDDTTQSPE